MFKILDRYIIRKFLGTYIFAIVLLLAIVNIREARLERQAEKEKLH